MFLLLIVTEQSYYNLHPVSSLSNTSFHNRRPALAMRSLSLNLIPVLSLRLYLWQLNISDMSASIILLVSRKLSAIGRLSMSLTVWIRYTSYTEFSMCSGIYYLFLRHSGSILSCSPIYLLVVNNDFLHLFCKLPCGFFDLLAQYCHITTGFNCSDAAVPHTLLRKSLFDHRLHKDSWGYIDRGGEMFRTWTPLITCQPVASAIWSMGVRRGLY